MNKMTTGMFIVVLALASTATYAQKQTDDGVVLLGETDVARALVVGLDKQDRSLTLIGSKGNVSHFEVAAEVRNFGQIQVGDVVKVEYHQSVALHIGDHGTQPADDAGLVVARAPKGAKPGVYAIGAVDASAIVQKLDRDQRIVALKGYDGHLSTLRVDKSVAGFDDLEVGDVVQARFTEAIAVSVQQAIPDTMGADAHPMVLLFAQNANGISFDSDTDTLTLKGVSPVVTFFSDRPNRIAGHVLLPGFIQLWDEGSDSFRDDPPNASISVFDGKQIKSAVIEIGDPELHGDRLSYKVVKVLDGDLSFSDGLCSIFIDGLFSGGAMGDGFRGAAGGALIGAIAGDAGKGAAIGAGLGVVGGAVKRKRHDEAYAQMQATTRVVAVANANGSSTPVALHLVANGWQGPKGEIYPALPSPDQLQSAYGMD
jgi:hypothetical protein